LKPLYKGRINGKLSISERSSCEKIGTFASQSSSKFLDQLHFGSCIGRVMARETIS
jgi:hypothetical protein